MCFVLRKLLIIFSACLSLSAYAATFNVDFDRGTQRPQISINGELTPEDGDRFSTIAHRYQEAIVSLNSPGGSLLSGIQIGTVIRLRAFNTVVKNNSMCASACAYAWLAGVQRYAEANSKIGFHAAYIVDRGIAKETGVGNALLGSYLARIGLTDEAIAYFTSAQPDEINWLNGSVAKRIRLNVYDYASIQRSPPPQGGQVASQSQTSNTNLEQASRNFINKLLAHWSTDNDVALTFLSEALAPQVNFYGKITDKSAIVKEKTTAMKRWPMRVYVERPSSISIVCSKSNLTCTVSGVLDWDARNPEKNRVSAGVAQFEYQLDFSTGSAKIIAENSTVLERK